MKINGLGGGKLGLAGLLAGFFLAASAVRALAGLGGNDASIESDATAMRGKMAASPQYETEPSASYNVKSFVTGNGVTVREYIAHSGPIFGIAWQGRRPPDLSVLLGSYYPEYTEASAAKEHVNLHRELIKGPDAVVILSGRMGHIVGRAYVPGLAPAGVAAETVVK
jgi:hypothetical protein